MRLPIQDEEEGLLGNLFPEAILGEITVNQEPPLPKPVRPETLLPVEESEGLLGDLSMEPEKKKKKKRFKRRNK